MSARAKQALASHLELRNGPRSHPPFMCGARMQNSTWPLSWAPGRPPLGLVAGEHTASPAASLGPWPQSPEREVWFRPEPGTVAQNRQHSLRGGRCPHLRSAGHRGGLWEDTGRPVAVPRGPATGKVSAATRDTRAGTWMLQLPRGQGGAPALARRVHSGPRAAPGLRRTPVCKPGGKKQLGDRGMAATPVGAMQSCSGTRTPPPPCSGPCAGPPPTSAQAESRRQKRAASPPQTGASGKAGHKCASQMLSEAAKPAV